MKDVKLRLDKDEIHLLDELVAAIKSRTSMNTNRTQVAMACFKEGWLVMSENFPLTHADPTNI